MQVYPEPAPPSPAENLRWLEDQLDVTYSPVCCSYNAGTTTLLLRLPSAAWGVGGVASGGAASGEKNSGGRGRDPSLDGMGWRNEGASEQSLVDIFGRIHSLDALKLQRQPGSWGAADAGLVDLVLPKGQDSCSIPQGSDVGLLSQSEETAVSCGGGSTNAERSESSLSPAEFKPCDEAYSLRSFLNSCFMLPTRRKLSGGWRKKTSSSTESQLTRGPEAAAPRGLPFLQWRSRFPKLAAAGCSGAGGEGSSAQNKGSGGGVSCFSRSLGGYANHQRETRVGGEFVQHASRLLSLRRKGKRGSADSGRANVTSPLSMGSVS
ncbi:hypothetical protein, conserved [Eimeria tenella]|uniref:Uncharacterized protein n=1 Tax=Eimeria tenella TaxID=5802 RepID=U6KYQ1_EIMTE|nr:hypothetical protein, conserved [Eimeria tenella]CDJ43307.1 hypothetical protein, conserved [Eimeria tenella]|eukprot:XP_013234057.1 hypothetical protein, conserved [Eimeria tenella]